MAIALSLSQPTSSVGVGFEYRSGLNPWAVVSGIFVIGSFLRHSGLLAAFIGV